MDGRKRNGSLSQIDQLVHVDTILHFEDHLRDLEGLTTFGGAGIKSLCLSYIWKKFFL